MYSEKDVSIVVPVFNIKDRLGRLLASLERQGPDPRIFETIVIDDGSSDGTSSWLDQYGGPLTLKKVIHESNRGRSAARNSGIANASRALILFLDGDVIASPDILTKHAAFHAEVPRALVGGVRYSAEFGVNGFTRYLETRGVLRLREIGKIPPRHFLSGHASVPKWALEKVGGFDETIAYGEDIDLGLRLAESGVEVFGNPTIYVIHQHVRSVQETAFVTESFGYYSLPILIEKHPLLKRDLKLAVFGSPSYKNSLLRLCFTKPIFEFILGVVSRLSNVRFPSAVYRYILYRSYARGYLQSQKNTANS